MPNSPTLPEGTDTIITGAAATGYEDQDFDAASTTEQGFGDAATATGGTQGTGGKRATGTAAIDADDLDDADDLADDGDRPAASIRDQAAAKTAELKGQAGDRARDYAEQGKARALDALDNVSRMIGEAADTVDDKVGGGYGDYARRAQAFVDVFADGIRDKDVDALVADAREFVQRSPGLALSAATLVGFALVRIVKAGLEAPAAQATATSDVKPVARA